MPIQSHKVRGASSIRVGDSMSRNEALHTWPYRGPGRVPFLIAALTCNAKPLCHHLHNLCILAFNDVEMRTHRGRGGFGRWGGCKLGVGSTAPCALCLAVGPSLRLALALGLGHSCTALTSGLALLSNRLRCKFLLSDSLCKRASHARTSDVNVGF